VRGTEHIGFAAWDWEDGGHSYRTIYLLNIDWWSEHPIHQATLLLGEQEFNVDVERGIIGTITLCDGCAIMPKHPLTDVLGVEKRNNGIDITVQSTEACQLILYLEGKDPPVQLKVPGAGIHTVSSVHNDNQ
jgi:hypothetical protein